MSPYNNAARCGSRSPLVAAHTVLGGVAARLDNSIAHLVDASIIAPDGFLPHLEAALHDLKQLKDTLRGVLTFPSSPSRVDSGPFTSVVLTEDLDPERFISALAVCAERLPSSINLDLEKPLHYDSTDGGRHTSSHAAHYVISKPVDSPKNDSVIQDDRRPSSTTLDLERPLHLDFSDGVRPFGFKANHVVASPANCSRCETHRSELVQRQAAFDRITEEYNEAMSRIDDLTERLRASEDRVTELEREIASQRSSPSRRNKARKTNAAPLPEASISEEDHIPDCSLTRVRSRMRFPHALWLSRHEGHLASLPRDNEGPSSPRGIPESSSGLGPFLPQHAAGEDLESSPTCVFGSPGRSLRPILSARTTDLTPRLPDGRSALPFAVNCPWLRSPGLHPQPDRPVGVLSPI